MQEKLEIFFSCLMDNYNLQIRRIENTKIEEAFCDFLAKKDNQFERKIGTLQTATTISLVCISLLWVKTIVPLFLKHNIVLTADVDSLLKA